MGAGRTYHRGIVSVQRISLDKIGEVVTTVKEETVDTIKKKR